MASNKLSINPNKTEYVLFIPNNVNLPVNIINLGSNTIFPGDSAKNLNVIFQTIMSMDKHISSIIKSCFLQLRDIRRIRPFTSKTAAITLANAFVHSHLDFCNSLLYGLHKYSIHRLQKVQNTVARIITNSHFLHKTTTLKSLNWFSIVYRINFKICCITHLDREPVSLRCKYHVYRSMFGLITHRALSLGEPFYLSFAVSSIKYSFAPYYQEYINILLIYSWYYLIHPSFITIFL